MSDHKNDALGSRAKKYEAASGSEQILPSRIPVLIRVDGCHFHTFTRGCNQPFDDKLMAAMNQVALRLCSEIQGAQMAYVQSDEITILIHSYKRLESMAWFDNRKTKMETVSASIAGAVMTDESVKIFGTKKLAWFDSRAYVVPENDVCNMFIWRQNDATRNSVQMVARSLYSQRELHGKHNAELQEMIFKKGLNWDSLSPQYKRGRCIRKMKSELSAGEPAVYRTNWSVDNDIPRFNQNRAYIEDLLVTEEN